MVIFILLLGRLLAKDYPLGSELDHVKRIRKHIITSSNKQPFDSTSTSTDSSITSSTHHPHFTPDHILEMIVGPVETINLSALLRYISNSNVHVLSISSEIQRHVPSLRLPCMDQVDEERNHTHDQCMKNYSAMQAVMNNPNTLTLDDGN